MTTHSDHGQAPAVQERLLELAGWWRRVGATLIDLIVVAGLSAILALATDGYHLHHKPGGGLIAHQSAAFVVGSIAIGVLYQLITLCRPGTRNGQTLGDQFLGVSPERAVSP
jgi:hypothetical protein